jgi:hypothetical protein
MFSFWNLHRPNCSFCTDFTESAEISFGSSFGCFESKLVSKDTLFPSNDKKSYGDFATVQKKRSLIYLCMKPSFKHGWARLADFVQAHQAT